MPAIGHVVRDGNGFRGELKTLSIRTEIMIVPNASKTSDAQPDFRVTAGSVEVGAGWLRRSEIKGNDGTVTSVLAAPLFTRFRPGSHARPSMSSSPARIARHCRATASTTAAKLS